MNAQTSSPVPETDEQQSLIDDETEIINGCDEQIKTENELLTALKEKKVIDFTSKISKEKDIYDKEIKILPELSRGIQGYVNHSLDSFGDIVSKCGTVEITDAEGKKVLSNINFIFSR